MDRRPCLVCGRVRDDPLHGPPRGTLAHENVVPRIKQHAYDPGERRSVVRRMEDREGRVQAAFDKVME